MASSVVQICNRALSEMGTQSNIASLDEQSNEAVQCSLWYDNIRQSILRAAPWGCARHQRALTLLGTWDGTSSNAPYPQLFKYEYPSDCLKLRYIIWPTQTINVADSPAVDVGTSAPYWMPPSRQNRYLIQADVDSGTGVQTKVILSNVPGAVAVFTLDLSNPDVFDPMLDSAISAALAYKLVIPLSGNIGMRQQFRESAEGSLLNARAVDGNEAVPTSDHTPDWIAARGCNAYGYDGLGMGDGWGQWYSGWDNFQWGM